MQASSQSQLFISKKVLLITSVLMICIALTILLDAIESSFQHYSFYLSESLLFSSFWWLFLPLIYALYILSNTLSKKYQQVALIPLLVLAHLFIYPLVVLIISKVFFVHTFPFGQTFYYGLTEYSFVLLISYTVSFFVFEKLKRKTNHHKNIPNVLIEDNPQSFIQSFSLTDGDRHLKIETKDIQFLTANNPYVTIHHLEKRYLYNETLKAISQKMDSRIFVRIHKSSVVNLNHVQYYKSRLNGDYDLTMKDGSVVRLSRNFAADFKSKFKKSPQDTTD